MLHLHERFHPHDNRPLVIGALGNSITFGISTNVSWLHSVEVALNSLSVLDSTRKVLRVHTVNGAVRASSADFAALCYDEIWRLRGIEPVPKLDVAVIDYSFTSSVSQMAFLVDRLRSLPRPPLVLVLLYCPHTFWHKAAQQNQTWYVDRGDMVAQSALPLAASRAPKWRRMSGDPSCRHRGAAPQGRPVQLLPPNRKERHLLRAQWRYSSSRAGSARRSGRVQLAPSDECGGGRRVPR